MVFLSRRVLPVAVFALVLLGALSPDTAAQVPEPPAEPTTTSADDTTDKDAPYVPTAQSVVIQMLEVANVSEDDVVYDLGSGDGRIPITAARMFGARGVGIEIDSALIVKARTKAEEAGVADKVEFRQQNFFDTDLSDATVVALYLWPEINVKLRPKLLRQLDPGDRIVSHDFRMGDWDPDRVIDAGPGNTGQETIFLWTVPEDIPDDLLAPPDDPEAN